MTKKHPFRVVVNHRGAWTCPGCDHEQPTPRLFTSDVVERLEFGLVHARRHASMCPDLAQLNRYPSEWSRAPRLRASDLRVLEQNPRHLAGKQ